MCTIGRYAWDSLHLQLITVYCITLLRCGYPKKIYWHSYSSSLSLICRLYQTAAGVLMGGQVHLSQKGLSQSLSLHTDLCTHAQAACAYCYSCCHSARPNFTQDPVDLLQTKLSIFKDLKWTNKWATEPFLGLYHPFLYEASDFQNTYQYKKYEAMRRNLETRIYQPQQFWNSHSGGMTVGNILIYKQ